MKKYPVSSISNFRLQGRNVRGGICEDGAVRLFWAGSAFEVCVKATEVWALISSNYDVHEIWLAIEVNGYQIARFMSPRKPTLVCLARNLNPDKEYTVSIIKDTQPMAGDTKHELRIDSLALNDEGIFCNLKPHKCKIEFIGDSITSGEGLAGKPEETDWITQWFCASKTYAVQTAKLMDADWNSISLSGWGLSWSWEGDITRSIPLYYNQVCGVLRGYNQVNIGTCNEFYFDTGSDYVVINLGTNDDIGFHCQTEGKDNGAAASLAFISDVKLFLTDIRRYNPHAKIIWCWGMIQLKIVPDLIKKGVEDYKKQSGDKAVYTLELECMLDVEKKEEHKGSREHPGPRTHKKAAARIVDFISKL